MALYDSALLVSREIDGVVQTEVLKIGLQGGVVGGVSEVSRPAGPAVRSLWSVRWVDDCLVNYAESSSAPADSGPAVTRSRTEQWCMNFGDAQADLAAKQALQKAFPDRVIEQIAIDGIAGGGGSIHCATQQEPTA